MLYEVITEQTLNQLLVEIEKNPESKNLRVAFLIDEAHRSHRITSYNVCYTKLLRFAPRRSV